MKASALRSEGSVLIGILWCVALLSVVVVGILHTTWLDLRATKNYSDRIQARYIALAGIERTKALLYQDAQDRSRSAVNHSGSLFNNPEDFQKVAFARGEFSILRRGRQDEGGDVIYGVSDEESRLNANTATTNELEQLVNMTPDVAAAIVDWRDADNSATTGGAEADYYAAMQPPRQPRNAPFETVREILMVRGVTPALLLGDDSHQNGFLPESSDESSDGGFLASDVDAGWAGLMTVDSSINNVGASGEDRVNVQTADESALTAIPGITPEIARSIIEQRGRDRFQSIADLLDVRAPQPRNEANSQSGRSPNEQNRSGAQGNQQPEQSSGAHVISDELLMNIADGVTTSSSQNLPGVININTASLDVLACLPGVDRVLAQAIVSYRQSSGFFPNVAYLLSVPGMTHEIFKQVAPLVSARSETYRIISEGRVKSTGARQRIQEIVHVGLHDVTTLSYREDDL